MNCVRLTIGQLAAAAGVPTSTVRFYERAGLLKPDFRTDSNYRGYTGTALEQLQFIRSAQANGFSLNDIGELLRLILTDQSPCEDVVAILGNRLGEVQQRIKQLRQVERVLSTSLRRCCKGVVRICATRS